MVVKNMFGLKRHLKNSSNFLLLKIGVKIGLEIGLKIGPKFSLKIGLKNWSKN